MTVNMPTPTTPPMPMPTYEPELALGEVTLPCGPFMAGHWTFHPSSLLWTPDSSELVYEHNGVIWRVAVDGAYLQNALVANPYDMPNFFYGFHADLSPDGSQLAYTSCQFRTEFEVDPGPYPHIPEWYAERPEYHYEIALSGLDGEDQQRLTHNRWLDHYPVWSPDGDRIAFLSSDEISHREYYNILQLYTMLADGSDVQILVPELKYLARIPPAWSPDGRRLAFVVDETVVRPHSRAEYRRAIYTVRSDGLELVKIGEAGGRPSARFPSAAPTWSPDSERVAFAAFDGEEAIVHSVRYDGTDLRRVWSGGPDNSIELINQVSWSPDGSEILFVYRDINGTSYYNGIYVVRPDGSGLRSLHSRGTYILAAWSPDGSRIAVYDSATGRASFSRISTVSRDGTDLRVLVEADYDEHRLAQSTQTEATTEPATSTPDPALPKPTATAPGLGQ